MGFFKGYDLCYNKCYQSCSIRSNGILVDILVGYRTIEPTIDTDML
jgi:hypothetical protein